MRRRLTPLILVFAASASVSRAQQSQQPLILRTTTQPWVVSVVHTIDSDKIVERLRQQQNVRVGVPGNTPQKVLNIATGLIIDGEGHVVTRLANLAPEDRDASIIVTGSNGSRQRARVVGIDCATGFTVLEVPGLKGLLPTFAPTSLLAQGLGVKIFSADATVRNENGKAIHIDYTITEDRGMVGPGSVYAKARGALTLNSSNILARSDGSIVTTFDGQVAGIAQYAGFGRAYLFPFEFIRDTVARRVLQKNDSVSAGWLGIKVDGLGQLSEPEFSGLGLPRRSGVIVRELVPGSPATVSGLKSDDVLVGIDEFDINNRSDLSFVLSSLPAGQNVKLRVVRKHDRVEMDAVLGARPYSGQMITYLESETADQSLAAQRDGLERRLEQLRAEYRSALNAAPSQQRDQLLGELGIEIRQVLDTIRQIQLQQPQSSEAVAANNSNTDPDSRLDVFRQGFAARDLDRSREPQLAAFFGVNKGVLVVSVIKGSPAERSGLKAGDVVVGNDRRGMTCTELESMLTGQRVPVPLRILRDKKLVVVSLAGKN